MDHFKGVNETERYNNEIMQQARKQTELLEQIAQLLQRLESNKDKRPYTRKPDKG